MIKKFHKGEFYFCLYLTENEHYIVEDRLLKWCDELNLSMLYYRQLKDGHIPMYREIKIVGDSVSLGKLYQRMLDDKLDEHIEPNPHKEICVFCGLPCKSSMSPIDEKYYCILCKMLSNL